MSKLDEELTGRFGKAERPLPVDPQLFAGLLKRRIRLERMKRASTVGLVLVIGVAGAMAYAFAERGATLQPGSTATISPALPTQAAVAATIPGIPFPACHPTSLNYYSERSEYGSIYLFGRGKAGAACPELDSRNAYLGLNVGNLGPGPKPQIFGPIDCFTGCRIFGAPDIDGDGRPELAVVVVDGTGADEIELYRIRPDSDPPFVRVMTTEAGKSVPFSFDWGGSDGYRSGATCPTTSEPTNQHPNPPRSGNLLVWSARRRGGVWHVVERDLPLNGATITQRAGARYTAPSEEFFPDGGGTDFCGAPVTP
jgi:hypothetical protein